MTRVIWLQTPTVFWVGGATISLSCFMYMGLVTLSRHKYIGERGASWHTFHFFIFQIFSVLDNLNIRAQLLSNTLGLQSELYNFHAICK